MVHEPGGCDQDIRSNPTIAFLLAVSGGDGHHAVLSWAEIDADFGNAPMLLATCLDGEDLDAAGTQLVVPSDRCGARYISAVTSIWIGACRLPASSWAGRGDV